MSKETAVKPPSLIDIGHEAMRIEEILYEEVGELTPELEARLNTLLENGAASLDAAAWVLRKMDAEKEALETESKRLKERAKSIERGQDNLRGRMLYALDYAFGGKLKTERNTMWSQESAGGLQIDLAPDADLARLNVSDSEFVKKTYAIDTQAVRQRFEAGDSIPDAIVVTRTPSKRTLRIR